MPPALTPTLSQGKKYPLSSPGEGKDARMSWRERPPERLTIEQAYDKKLNLETIRPLGRFVAADPPTRKGDLVPLLSKAMKRIDVVRRLYDQLDERNRAAVRE